MKMSIYFLKKQNIFEKRGGILPKNHFGFVILGKRKANDFQKALFLKNSRPEPVRKEKPVRPERRSVAQGGKNSCFYRLMNVAHPALCKSAFR